VKNRYATRLFSPFFPLSSWFFSFFPPLAGQPTEQHELKKKRCFFSSPSPPPSTSPFPPLSLKSPGRWNREERRKRRVAGSAALFPFSLSLHLFLPPSSSLKRGKRRSPFLPHPRRSLCPHHKRRMLRRYATLSFLSLPTFFLPSFPSSRSQGEKKTLRWNPPPSPPLAVLFLPSPFKVAKALHGRKRILMEAHAPGSSPFPPPPSLSFFIAIPFLSPPKTICLEAPPPFLTLPLSPSFLRSHNAKIDDVENLPFPSSFLKPSPPPFSLGADGERIKSPVQGVAFLFTNFPFPLFFPPPPPFAGFYARRVGEILRVGYGGAGDPFYPPPLPLPRPLPPPLFSREHTIRDE